jgi:exodeoxyribonuclease V beta subunit
MTAQVLDPLALPLRGPHLIEASAGTGKTFTIATLFVRLIVERGMSADEVLVVTFTEAAAAELRDRIRGRLRDTAQVLSGDAEPDPGMAPWFERRRAHQAEDLQRVQAAVRAFDEAAISTIHGFCHRVLHDAAFETGTAFDTELIANQQPLLDEAVRDYWARELYGDDRRFVTHALRSGLRPPDLLSLAWIAAANPGVTLVPPVPDADTIDTVALEDAFDRAFRKARALWHEQQADIRAVLDATLAPGAKILHGGKYKPGKVRMWLDAAEVFFHPTTPGEHLSFERLDMLTTEGLRAGCNKGKTPPQHPFFDACSELQAAAGPLEGELKRRALAFKHGLARYLDEALPKRKQAKGVQSFDDLLHNLAAVVGHPRRGKALTTAVRETYRAALIDEFQDTDPIQFQIFHGIFGGGDGNHPLMLIGDPKQAIYGFRGADVFAYLKAGAGIDAQRRHTMTTNWRSDPGVLSAVEHLFTTPAPFILDAIDFVSVGPRPGATDVLRCDGQTLAPFEIKLQAADPNTVPLNPRDNTISSDWVTRELPHRIAADIRELLASNTEIDGRPIRARDIAVLSRTNRQAQQVQAALRELGIPGVVYGDSSVYDTTECEELERVLSAIAEPTSTSLLRAALTTEMLGVSGGELEDMADDDEAWEHWANAFRRWHAAWVQRGFIHMLRAMLTDLRLGESMLRLTDGERRMTNLLHLTELMHEAASRDHLGPTGLLHWLADQKKGDQQLAAEAVKLRLERDDEAVQLITIHRSKGLEYPVVYCPYLWGSAEPWSNEYAHLKYHNPERDHALEVDIGPKPKHDKARDGHPSVKQAKLEAFAEGLRLLYVALTRARHRCVVVWGRFPRFHHSPLGYLLFGPFSEPGQDPYKAVPDRLRHMTDAEQWSLLEQRKHASWAISELGERARPLRAEAKASPAALHARTPRSSIDRLYRTTSFTGIASAHGAADLTSGRDVDQTAAHEAPTTPSDDTTVRLAEFPRGAHVGNFFHEVLEFAPFDSDDATLREHVDAGLRKHGLEDGDHAELAVAGLRDVLSCPLDTAGHRLCDLPAQDTLAELGFVLPVAAALTDGQGASRALDPGSLRRAFATDPTGLPPGYLDRLSTLSFIPVRGYLRGFIDLVYRVDGRWYVADYKTNDLGTHPDDYVPARLAEAMAHEHYVLQYHLYTAAFCRHLRLRQPDFDYDTHFGGALYLFLRGMDPARGPSRGIYAERPPRARIEAIDALLDPGDVP